MIHFSTNQKLACQQQQLKEDFERLKVEETERSQKLQQLV